MNIAEQSVSTYPSIYLRKLVILPMNQDSLWFISASAPTQKKGQRSVSSQPLALFWVGVIHWQE